jgi:formyltetrahydrofolate hydrolase
LWCCRIQHCLSHLLFCLRQRRFDAYVFVIVHENQMMTKT